MSSFEVAISVIVPVFNSEEYLNSAIDSILKQSFSNFELVLVNDGSVDGSRKICESFTDQDKRVKLVNKNNGGVSSARNAGLKNSKGNYIFFVDADDILLPDALENLYFKAIYSNADITVADYAIQDVKNKKQKLVQHEECDSGIDFLFYMLKGKYHAGLWNKFFKFTCFSDLLFDELVTYMEDKLILTAVLLNKPSVSFLHKPVYIYVQRYNSLTNSFGQEALVSIGRVIKQIEFMLQEYNIFAQVIISEKLKYKISLLRYSKDSSLIVNAFKELNKNILLRGEIAFFYRVLLWFEFHHISLFTRLFRIVRTYKASF